MGCGVGGGKVGDGSEEGDCPPAVHATSNTVARMIVKRKPYLRTHHLKEKKLTASRYREAVGKETRRLGGRNSDPQSDFLLWLPGLPYREGANEPDKGGNSGFVRDVTVAGQRRTIVANVSPAFPIARCASGQTAHLCQANFICGCNVSLNSETVKFYIRLSTTHCGYQPTNHHKSF